MVEQLFSAHSERGDPPEMPDLAQSFVGDMPIAKLVMVGALSEQELAELIEVVNRDRQ